MRWREISAPLAKRADGACAEAIIQAAHACSAGLEAIGELHHGNAGWALALTGAGIGVVATLQSASHAESIERFSAMAAAGRRDHEAAKARARESVHATIHVGDLREVSVEFLRRPL